MYCMTSSRRSCSKSTSMSGGSWRSAETKRSNSRSERAGSTSVMPRQKQTAELAAEPRPWQRMPSERAKRTTSSTVRKKGARSEEHTSELQSLMRSSYAVFCLKKKKTKKYKQQQQSSHIHQE